MATRIYVSKHCEPCQKIKELMEKGKVPKDIEVVDIETDEGFAIFSSEVLSNGDSFVPSAYKDGKMCKIKVDDETEEVSLDCDAAPEPS